MRVIVVGAGPIGLEAGARLVADGHDVEILEAEHAGSAVRRWAHVRAFTPWSMNTTPIGRERVGDPGLAASNVFPTGEELVSRYLEPLAAGLPVRAGCKVVGIARAPLGFRLLIRGPNGDAVAHADAVLDCTGVLGDPVPTGVGGLPALRERELGPGRLLAWPVRVDHLGGRRVLLVGDGASAYTALRDLLDLEPTPEVTWLTMSAGGSFASSPDDPLPERRALHAIGERARPHVRQVVTAGVHAYTETADGVNVELADGTALIVDTVVACCGFRPDLSLCRELQVHLGPELVHTSEPRFFVLGNKSYGRRSDFLLATGHRQVEEVVGSLS